MSGSEQTARRSFPKLKRVEKVNFISQLALMLDTGIALDTALRATIEQASQTRLGIVINDIHDRIQDGVDLSSAMANHPKSFDPVFVAMVKASEQTGTLSQCLMQQADHLEREHLQRKKIRSAMTYPTLMFVMAIGVVILLVCFVLPQFGPMLKQRGVKLPASTRWLMWAGEICNAHPVWVAIGAIGASVGIVIAYRKGIARGQLDMVKLRAPIWGKAYRKAVLCRSVRTLGLLLSNQVPVLDCLKLCAKVAGNRCYESAWLAVAENVSAGARIGDSLPGNLFPPTLRQMLRAGEETGRLPDVLSRVSMQYERDVESSFKAAASLMEPLMMSGMGLVIGGIAWSLLLPIFSLSKPG